jgi:hypothetical protein
VHGSPDHNARPAKRRDTTTGVARRVDEQARQAATTQKSSHEAKKRADAEARKLQRAAQAQQAAIDALEKQIADCESALREIEQTMAAPGFYDDRDAAKPIIDRHQELMWKTGDLMHQWEKLQAAKDLASQDKIVI